MTSLFAQAILNDFVRRDTSRERIVTRTARRLEKRGLEITKIECLPEKRDTRVGEGGLRHIDVRQTWRISILGQDRLSGTIEVRQKTAYVERREGAGTFLSFEHFFVTDSAATERLLRDGDAARRKRRGALVCNRGKL